MSTEYSGTTVNGFPATITLASAGDPDKLASINDGISDLADRTKCLEGVIAVPILNWHPTVFVDTAAADIDSDEGRYDGTAVTFFSSGILRWFAFGRPTEGDFYVLDESQVYDVNSGDSMNYHFGCGSADRLLFFCADEYNVGSSHFMEYSRSDANSFTNWTNLILPGSPAIAARASDAVVYADADVVVVGGIDGTYKSWKSVDNGATFAAAVTAGAGVTVTASLTRAVLGRAERLWAWEYETFANGGQKLYYSDNKGTTWLNVTLAQEKIRGLVYVEQFDTYVLLTDSAILVSTDPESVTFAGTGFGGGATGGSIATDGVNVVFTVDQFGDSFVFASANALGTPARFVYRSFTPINFLACGRDKQFAAFGNFGTASIRLSLKSGAA